MKLKAVGKPWRRCPSVKPDVVLLDLNLPDMPGQEAAKQIRHLFAGAKIIICSLANADVLAAVAQQVGADGYFAKGSGPEDLHSKITAVLTMNREQQKSDLSQSLKA